MATTTADDSSGDVDQGFVAYFSRLYPKSLPLAAVLSIVAFVATIPYVETLTQFELFATGFFDLYTVQMPLILFWVLSAAVVQSRWGGRFLDRIADLLPIDSQARLIYATGFIALVFGWINWALGFIGAIFIGYRLSKEAEERGILVHYPAVLTASLLSLVVMNQGLSSPGALLMANTDGTTNFLVDPEQGQIVLDMATFLAHPVNIISVVVFVFSLPMLLVVLAPSAESERRPVSEFRSFFEGSITEALSHYSPPPREEWTFADRLEQSPVISIIAFLLGAASVVAYFATGGRLTMLWLLFALMMIGILVQVRPMAYVDKTRNTVQWANHVAVPFVLYAGAYALFTEAELYTPIGDALTATGAPQISSYIIAFILGLFVPDPGSVWVLQGPALVTADANLASSMVSVMYGAGISNLWLAFLFVGILAPLTGFSWREYAKYAGTVTLYMTAVIIVLMTIF